MVKSQHDPSLCWVCTEEGAFYRRNHINLRPRTERPEALSFVPPPADKKNNKDPDEDSNPLVAAQAPPTQANVSSEN